MLFNLQIVIKNSNLLHLTASLASFEKLFHNDEGFLKQRHKKINMYLIINNTGTLYMKTILI